MRKILLIISLLLPTLSWADVEAVCTDSPDALAQLAKVAEAINDNSNCPNARPLRGICNHVLNAEVYDGEPSHIAKLKQAACVTKGESAEAEGKKIREMWDKYEDLLICNNISFSITGGNIIKATVLTENSNLLNTFFKWGVNLNRVDPVDNRTVLDYIRDEQKRNPPPATKLFLEQHYLLLKQHGAKHKSEL